jgi:glutathione S-transferase
MATRRTITLYHSPASRAFTSYWLLEELGVGFQVKTVDIAKGEQKSPEYLKLNPSGKVPTVADGGVVVSESAAIGTATAMAAWRRGSRTPSAAPT